MIGKNTILVELLQIVEICTPISSLSWLRINYNPISYDKQYIIFFCNSGPVVCRKNV
jgi:hypothetical protein